MKVIYTTQKQINEIYNKTKNQFPPDISEEAIKEIIKIQQAFKKDAKEHSCVINLETW